MDRVDQHADRRPDSNRIQNLDGRVEVSRTIEHEGDVNETQGMVVRYLEFEGGAAVGSGEFETAVGGLASVLPPELRPFYAPFDGYACNALTVEQALRRQPDFHAAASLTEARWN